MSTQWRAVPASELMVSDSWIVEEVESMGVIALVYDENHQRLIAAAPDLLAALKTFTNRLWPEIDGEIKATPDVKAAWRAGKDAIAKAEGR